AHAEVVAGVLRTPIAELVKDIEDSRRESGTEAHAYVEAMRERFNDLLPAGKQDSPSANHLSSVLLALSKLKKDRARATQSISYRRRQPGRALLLPAGAAGSAPAPERADAAAG